MSRHLAAKTILLPIALMAQMTAARALDDVLSAGSFSLDVSGYGEGRVIMTSTTQSWENAGLGKVRYGGGASGGRDVLARAEGAVVLQPKFGFDWTGTVVLTAAAEQRQTVDITEAFLQYKPAPAGEVGFRAKAGAFFPPISAENSGLAWTSPYTVTSSAINSWVGEELKTIGGEATIFRRTEDLELDLTGAVYMANDPAGTLLAWRGWSFNDRETGLLDRLQLAPIRIIRPTGKLATQASTEKPFHEVDQRAGFYAALSAEHADFGKLSVLWYDNRANDHGFEKGQWAWRTKFLSVSYKNQLANDIDVIAQFMQGTTTVITIPKPVGPIVYTAYWSAFGLVSKDWDRNRISLRAEYFKTTDRDIFPDNNNEHGMALTAAYVFRPSPHQRLTFELLYVNSLRLERTFMALPARAHETQSQISYRFLF